MEFCSEDDWRGLVKVYAACKNPACGKPEGVGELSYPDGASRETIDAALLAVRIS